MKRLSAYISTFFRAVKLRGFFYTLKLIRYELAFDRKYKTHTKTVEHLQGKTLAAEPSSEFFFYQGASYFVLKEVFNEIPLSFKSCGFIDFGCGKAKAMICAAETGFNTIKGVELALEIFEQGKKNIEQAKHYFPESAFHIHYGSADNFNIAQEDCTFYFFNPFGPAVFEAVLNNIIKSYQEFPRTLLFIYLNPKYSHVFEKPGFRIFKELTVKNYTEAIIYRYG